MSHTTIIIIITTIISVMAFNNRELMRNWIFNAYMIKNHGQVYRFLTSGFLHANWVHLIFNMVTLHFLGDYVAYDFYELFGRHAMTYYWALYLSAIVISSIPTYFKHKDHEFYNSLGASGAVSAIVFCFILLRPADTLWIFGVIPMPGILLGGLYLIYTFQMSRRANDNINHDAHLWGAIYGMAFLIILKPAVIGYFLEQMKDFSLF